MLAVLYMATAMETCPRQTAHHCLRVSMRIRSSKMDKTDMIYQNSQQHLIHMAAGMRTLAVAGFNLRVSIPISIPGSKCGTIVRIYFVSSEFKPLGTCR